MCNRAISKAAKEQFNLTATEGVTCLTIGDVMYEHEPYNYHQFNSDKEMAKELQYGDEVIREITLMSR